MLPKIPPVQPPARANHYRPTAMTAAKIPGAKLNSCAGLRSAHRQQSIKLLGDLVFAMLADESSFFVAVSAQEDQCGSITVEAEVLLQLFGVSRINVQV